MTHSPAHAPVGVGSSFAALPESIRNDTNSLAPVTTSESTLGYPSEGYSDGQRLLSNSRYHTRK